MNINLSNLALRFRARVFNSSDAALEWGYRDPKARGICRKIIQVKNSQAKSRWHSPTLSPRERTDLGYQIRRYERTLSIFDNFNTQCENKNDSIAKPSLNIEDMGIYQKDDKRPIIYASLQFPRPAVPSK